ncbi:MAG TPA: hypothetical protein P5527_02490 [Kiritimatiellia bacterium]|jgi:hypothetical protein|nr:hypothetical protein [Kiritimatiellia bacterium]
MNNTATITPTARPVTDAARVYRPRLSFFHANSKGTGSAVRFELMSATGERDGAIFMTLAQQKSVASGSVEQGNRRYATFDWQNRITVKLNFTDLSQLLLVLKGVTATIADGKGLYHDTRAATTLINLTRQTEPYAGYALDVSRRAKDAPDATTRVRIFFNNVEAFGLGMVLEQALSVVAFGVPRGPSAFGASPFCSAPSTMDVSNMDLSSMDPLGEDEEESAPF